MKKIIIALATLIIATPVMVFPKARLTPAQQQEQLLSRYKYQYKFVNDYTTAVPLTITVKFEDGTQSVGYINSDSPLIFPSDYCMTYFKVEGHRQTEKFEAGHGYLVSEDISTSHEKKLCGSRTLTIVPINNDPYIQFQW